MFGRKKHIEASAPAAGIDDLEVDPETGLVRWLRFEELLDKEIARGLRYGSSSSLALFEVGIAERSESGPLPSPARFVAQVLNKAIRSSDVAARLSHHTFAVLLVEARAEGAANFTERIRTAIGSNPYARRPDGTGLFARAWAGVAGWQPGYDSVQAYVGAAQSALASTYRGYEAAQDFFRGEGVNRPFLA